MRRNNVRLLILGLAWGVWAQALPVPNASFENGDPGPAGWTLSEGTGKWATDGGSDGTHAIAVTGTGEDSNYWRSEALPFKPGTVYRVDFDASSPDGSGGTPITGPAFCNRDIGQAGKDWTAYSSIFVTPRTVSPDEAWLRFGQWSVKGTVRFDNIRLTEVQAVHRSSGDLVLGEGERLEGNSYTFAAPFNTQSRNHSRALESAQCGFNSNRWVFGAGSDVVYRHRIGSRQQTAAAIEATVGYHAGGELVLEVSRDGAQWRQIGTQGEKGTRTCAVPADLLPASDVWVRLRAQAKAKVGQNSDPGSFQIHGYEYRATLDGAAAEAAGKTWYIVVTGADPNLDVALDGLGAGIPGADNVVTAQVTNRSQRELKLQPVVILQQGSRQAESRGAAVTLAAGAAQRFECAYRIPSSGAWTVRVELGGDSAYRGQFELDVPAYYETAYGELLPATSGKAALWWASSGWKIPRQRPLPEAKSNAILIRTARNEVEAAQFVLRPAEAIRGLRIVTEALTGPEGGVIPADRVEVLRVGYVPVRQPTDDTGVAADWPDPLPPLKVPLDLKAGENQPFWLRVKAPLGIPAGLYTGNIRLEATDYRETVPLQVEVYGFDLPRRMTCQTAFGFSPGNVWRYQKITDPDQRRAVLDKYLRNYSDHHISVYNPAPLDPFSITWPSAGAWNGGTRDQTEKHAGRSSLLVKDDSATGNASAAFGKRIAIPEKGLRLHFWYKTAQPGHTFIVTFGHSDAGGSWMSGRNNDMVLEGNGQWQEFDRTVTAFPEGAKSVNLTLWATLWHENGTPTGAVWYDDASLTDAGTGQELLEGGDFEPIDVAAIQPVFDWTAWDQAMDKAVTEYGFNTFRMPLQGMGGGTFYSRDEPSLLGYTENTPEYKAAFRAYAQGIQEHLREKGFLDEAFIYWFDEPDPKDYEFVMNGFRRLKENAPDLRRMLTEQVEEGLVGGPNLWCPLTPEFANMEKVEARRQAGDQFWWYICCGPKAPYCTEFIDHPGTELRVWLWQTWQRQVEGILIWESNYWTSSSAYPDPKQLQNPYDDPMSWVCGYGTPAGTKSPWGNGDGRFLYPPEAAGSGVQAETVLDGPVDSQRWEMLRDGIEDYEYFAILQRLLAAKRDRLAAGEIERYEALLKVPDAISTDLTHFTTDPAPVEQRRAEVARGIMDLMQRP
ncbi:MAG: hypothetical protein A3K19_08480 [Lentisphaerae bacterium RIFOXYB12_FULL_65_16]|nr:MAG: hypothetical protein A3K18_15600 [Lentisphaerae bacterium RIFOXYA12_64_32]OGV93442.1 MAG: hypothetical protein A3K19_08480 [Lentisphaerae bacterium RIFOXYB12_FULL_65_16]